MPILSGDIVLVKSAVMADVPEGGGPPSGSVIEDGASNAIFPDISELDRAVGRVALRKCFLGVRTDDVATYLGANVIVAEPFKDPRVSVTLFKALDTFEERASAQSRMEAYLFRGPLVPGYLLEDHIAGQRVVQLFYRPEWQPPAVGSALCLTQDDGLSTYKEQYVRVIKVSSQLRKFSKGGASGAASGATDYGAQVVSLELSDPLRYDFKGSPPDDTYKQSGTAAHVRETVVADASQYAGCVPLAQAAALGNFGLKASSIYAQLVPAAQAEVPLTGQQPYSAVGMYYAASPPLRVATSAAWTSTTALQLPGGFMPGSLSVVTPGPSFSDQGGRLISGGVDVGSCDYGNGLLSLASGDISGTKWIDYRPAVRIQRAPHSACIDVTEGSRSLSYVGFIDPVPQPGSLAIHYMVQKRWYTLQDSGYGPLRGSDASYGAGTIHHQTGAYVVTLGALPDVGSAIVVQWNVPTQETALPVESIQARQRLQLAPNFGQIIQPGTLTLSWPKHGGGTCSATVAADGSLSGDAAGEFWPGADVVDFVPQKLPPLGSSITADYVAGPKQIDDFSAPARDGAGKIPIALSLGACSPGSVEIRWNTELNLDDYTATDSGKLIKEMGVTLNAQSTHSARDDGLGHLKIGTTTVGTVDYATGAALLNPDVLVRVPAVDWSASHSTVTAAGSRHRAIKWVSQTSYYPPGGTGWVKALYNAPGSTTAQQEQIVFAPKLALVPDVAAQIVPGSVTIAAPLTVSLPASVDALGDKWVMQDMGTAWQDSGTGLFQQRTESGWIERGTISYYDGAVYLTSWTPGALNEWRRLGCATTTGEQVQSEYVFRTAAAPVRAGSLSVQFARADGLGPQTLTADSSGIIAAAGIDGTIDHETGLIKLRFGTRIVAAGNEAQPWFDAENVQPDGKIFKPAPIATSSIRYAAVAYSYMPLDASILGVDPVRLPTDGRVPIFRSGGVVVVGNTKRVTATVSNGQTIDCARVRLSRVRVVGSDGVVIHAGYSTDLEAGTVTFTDVTGYAQPVTIEHRIEDMTVVRDVQINGQMTFTRPLTHDYPLDGSSYVSSALVSGDIFARVPYIFDQHTWTGVWQDARIGDEALSTYDSDLYPIAVTNRGAITEDWLLRFTNTTTFAVIGKGTGQIGTGSINDVCAPINPASGAPYFSINPLGWGTGWAAGECVRFQTVGAQMPFWALRTVQQGQETVSDDSCVILGRGDVDAP